MNAITEVSPAAAESELEAANIQAMLQKSFEDQRAAYLAHPIPTLDERRDDLTQLHKLIADNRDAIVARVVNIIINAGSSTTRPPSSSASSSSQTL